MQKAVFLLVQRGSPEWATLYRYVPYDWGPYSSQLAADIRTMENDGLLEVERGGASRYGRYRSTPKGAVAAAAIWEHLSQPEREFIRLVRLRDAEVVHELLREVYAAYPDFATASRFTG